MRVIADPVRAKTTKMYHILIRVRQRFLVFYRTPGVGFDLHAKHPSEDACVSEESKLPLEAVEI